MKLVLASQGFTTPEIAQKVSNLAGKTANNLNIAIINEAYTAIVAGRDESWLIAELANIAKYTKATISFVNLRAYDIDEIKVRLEFADIIYIVGGAQLVLPKLFKETGFDKLLRELADTKVIMGTSAGAMILGKQIEDPKYWQNQYGSSTDYLASPYLGMVDFNILPHYGRADHPLRNKEKLIPILSRNPFPIYGITDEQAVIYDKGNTIFIGGDPVKFGDDSK